MITSGRHLRTIIDEALKKSDAERVARVMKSAVQGSGARVMPTVDTSGGLINLFIRMIEGDPDAVGEVLQSVAADEGWSLLSKAYRKGWVWWFEPAPELKGPVDPELLPATLYHRTHAKNVESILQAGLIPGQRTAPGTTRKYTGRVYLATDPGGAMLASKGDEGWAMLAINVGLLPPGISFYVDQEFGHRKGGMPIAVYTMQHVPAQAVSVL